ncbi:MAG: DEAD/DEAH box helicase [Armatimonadota bacterium]
MDVFDLRNKLISDYESYVRSFVTIRTESIKEYVDSCLQSGLLWPEPLIQMNPSFEPGDTIDSLVEQGILHEKCKSVFRIKNNEQDAGLPLRLHRHQSEAVRVARNGDNYVLTTGTGSGKSLAYIVPITDHVLRHGSGKGIKAVVVYPMNALANSQYGELTKFLCHGFTDGKGPVTFARYTGQETDEERNAIIANPPDILLTNYVMLELILTRPAEKGLISAAQGLKFLVLDELHTYRGRQGADVGLLVRRVADRLSSGKIQCIGTSATLAGVGTFSEQRKQVAEVASTLFGTLVKPEHVIGETLRRTTPERQFSDHIFVTELQHSIVGYETAMPDNYDAFVVDPLSSWIETTFGVYNEPKSGRLIRSTPRNLTGALGAAKDLSSLCELSEDICAQAIRSYLLAGYEHKNPETGFSIFAFRLHQFISRGDTVYASLEPDAERHLTTQAQQYVPGNRDKYLYPLGFCRECGQEYYRVKMVTDQQTGDIQYQAPDADEQPEEDTQQGYIYCCEEDPWPVDDDEVLSRLPDDWIEEYKGQPRVKPSVRKNIPQYLCLDPAGRITSRGTGCVFVPAPFKFCLRCGIVYYASRKNDFPRLATLTSEGRSTATTVLSLSAIKYLRNEPTLKQKARKLLSFTDNRQDASLQAGHFNDFVEIGILRSAIYRAAASAGPSGMRHEELTHKVFEALGLPIDNYATDSDVRFAALEETKRALREILGYRIYRDLKRGWRITSPNLEQCGLLTIKYLSLDDVCQAEDLWEKSHPALAKATPETRHQVSQTLLDWMRRELAIKVNYLDRQYQESIQQLSNQRLIEPWALDDNEITSMEYSTILYPRSRAKDDFGGNAFLSPRGGFGNYLGRKTTFLNYLDRLSLDEKSLISRQLLSALKIGGMVEVVTPPKSEHDVAGYQLTASSLLWIAGDGTVAYHDPIRIPRTSDSDGHTNQFFVDFYREAAAENIGLEAREHTAQVGYIERIRRETMFKEGKLPIMFCSPTMELGVDISELNVVNMRNIPPTPANYAQRSGRAGRSGQPALVFSYCTTGSPHDQYFFKRPHDMVSGSVVTPRLDLANEDLVRAHVHSVWLAETGLSLGKSLKDVLNLSDESANLPLLSSVADDTKNVNAKNRARSRCASFLPTIQDSLDLSTWYTSDWLDDVLDQVTHSFDRACDRWRTLYVSALRQARAQDGIIRDPTRSQSDKDQAKRLRREAENQQALLTDVENVVQSDFYSYRYFASEGFLPGYSFPRLPLSAFIPARRQSKQKDGYLSRPRFLAISEFGPRAIVYHEGSRYVIDKVILPVADPSDQGGIGTTNAKLCVACGYLHPISQGNNPDRCERCDSLLDSPLRQLFRLQNVSTKRRDKINSDEEERMRMGYEIVTGARFAVRSGIIQSQAAVVMVGESPLATLTYGDRATIWRINLGWKRRANPNQYGFTLDVERGYWAKAPTDDEREDVMSPRKESVIPYVEDWRNCLLFEPAADMPGGVMASLQAALKNAIQAEYQLEDNELAIEPLPNRDDRKLMLFYEAAEGGAGVLRRLVDDPKAFAQIAKRALEICHFDPVTGVDVRRAPNAAEDCEAACYDCLMSYSNQLDHKLLDRMAIHDILVKYGDSTVNTCPVALPRSVHMAELKRLAQSTLETQWLDYIDSCSCRLPSRGQVLIEQCGTRPDFIYDDQQAVIYVDGPHHLYPERALRDKAQTDALEDGGYLVLRFNSTDDWAQVIAHYPHIFGVPQ